MPTCGGLARLERPQLAGQRVVDADLAHVAQARPGGGRRSAHGRSASICAASESSVASSSGRPTSWTPSGRPSSVKPAGTEPPAGRWGSRCRCRDRRRPARAACAAALMPSHSRRAHRRASPVIGVSSTSWSSKTRLMRSACAASSRRARSSTGRGDRRCRAGEAARAPLEALRARHAPPVLGDAREVARRSKLLPARCRSRGRLATSWPSERSSSAVSSTRAPSWRSTRAGAAAARERDPQRPGAAARPQRRRSGAPAAGARADVEQQRGVGHGARLEADHAQPVPVLASSGASETRSRCGLRPKSPQ